MLKPHHFWSSSATPGVAYVSKYILSMYVFLWKTKRVVNHMETITKEINYFVVKYREYLLTWMRGNVAKVCSFICYQCTQFITR